MHRRVKQVAAEERHTNTPSDLLSELHVYILPQSKWIPFRRLARNTVVEETVSAGFIRVPHDMTLTDLRQELRGQLIDDDLPEHFVYIKCVGRNFTQVKPRQEYVVKVKNFLPPQADEPEIHILEISEELLRYAPSLSNLIASDNEMSDSHGANSRLSSRLQHFELFQRHGNNLKPEDAERSQGGDSDGGYDGGQGGRGWGQSHGGRRWLVPEDRWGR
ncbi:spermatogenesis-associated protein 1-like [Eriocheir sinensis]|uniref:spermatogenesis-associated protein 1-like n=1 Tax=Eriocheir sinensis TaxID=95602 RepID=UPI0021C6F019|nr:spermatogenesis-associated protein 1-like [Eriocheir sinensis]